MPPIVNKRPKVITACAQCAVRKTRCDLVTAAGCHRCRTLRTGCSLVRAPAEPMRPVSPARPIQYFIEEAETSYQSAPRSLSGSLTSTILTTRLDRMERKLDSICAQNRLSSKPVSIANEPLDWKEVGVLRPLSIASMAYSVMGQPSSTFDDPLDSGIVSPHEWTNLYERFWHSVNALLPLQELGFDLTSPPRHRFVRTALLYYLACIGTSDITMSHNQRRSIYDFTTEQVGLASQARPSEDTVVGMLILSLSSVRQLENCTAVADPFRAAALGLDMAMDIALDDVAQRFGLQMTGNVWIRDDVAKRKTCLWYAISHRHTFTKITTSVSLGQGTGMLAMSGKISLIDALASRSELLAHLAIESELLGLIEPVLRARRIYTNASTYDADLLVGCRRALDDCLHALKQFRTNISQTLPVFSWKFLVIQSHHISYALAQQGVTLSHSTPSPVASEIRFESLGNSGLTMITASADLLEIIIAGMLPLSSLPGVLIPPIYLIVAGYKSWRLREVMENMNPPRQAPDLEAVYTILQQQHAKADLVLSRISAMREQISEAAVRRREPPHQIGSSSLLTLSETQERTQALLPAPINWNDAIFYLPDCDLAWLDAYIDPIATLSQRCHY